MLGENIITSSLVLYKTKLSDIDYIINSVLKSEINKLYVIDNSPTDDLKEIIDSFRNKRIEYIYGHGNIGYGRANNIGLQKAIEYKSKYHIILNPDIIFESNVIAELRTYMDKNEDVGQILPNVTYPDGTIQYLCKLLPHPVDIFARRLLPPKYSAKRNYRYEMHGMGYDKIWNCPILSGCFMFIRTKVLEDVGGFDPRFFMYFEDFDLMRRIHRVSKTIFYPYTSIIHNHAAEHRYNSKLFKEGLKSAIRYFNKWGWFFDKERASINKMAESNETK